MFIFAHLGIGSKLARPWRDGVSRPALFVGTILPDLIDKPLYYGLVLATGRRGAELGMIAGTRSFAHTALFLALLLAAAYAIPRRRRVLAALAIGVATHLLLDNVGDVLLGDRSRSAFRAMTWPGHGLQFPVNPYASLGAHLEHALLAPILACEAIGIVILLGDYWKCRRAYAIKGRTSRR